jgi:hypothetical protein
MVEGLHNPVIAEWLAVIRLTIKFHFDGSLSRLGLSHRGGRPGRAAQPCALLAIGPPYNTHPAVAHTHCDRGALGSQESVWKAESTV